MQCIFTVFDFYSRFDYMGRCKITLIKAISVVIDPFCSAFAIFQCQGFFCVSSLQWSWPFNVECILFVLRSFITTVVFPLICWNQSTLLVQLCNCCKQFCINHVVLTEIFFINYWTRQFENTVDSLATPCSLLLHPRNVVAQTGRSLMTHAQASVSTYY